MWEEARWLKVSLEGMPPKNHEPLTAGTSPMSVVNPLAIEVMREVGIDISKQRPKIITEDMIRQSTHRVSMGCMYKISYLFFVKIIE